MRWSKPATSLLLVVLAVMVAACGSSDGESSSTARSDGGGELSVWTFKKEWVPGIQAAAAAYERETGKRLALDVQYFDEANGVYASKVSAAARQRNLPDLLTAYGPQWDYVGAGLFQELNGKLDQELGNMPASLVDDFVKYSQATADTCAANKDCTYSDVRVGQYFTMPQISGATGYFYVNKDKLTEAGLDPEAIPANWAELIDAVRTTEGKLGGAGGSIIPLKIPETGWLWLLRPMLFTQIGATATRELFDDKTGAAWKSPEVVNTLKLYDEMSPYWVKGILQDGIEEADAKFVAGQATWYYGGTFSLAGLVQKGIDPSKLLIFPMPVADGAQIPRLQLKPWASGFIGISRNSGKSELATEFLKFYMSPAGAQPFADAVSDTPAVTLPRTTGAEASPLADATQASFGTGTDAYDEFVAYGPQCDAAKTLANQASVALTGLVTGDTTPEELASKLADLYQKAWNACG